MTATKKSAPAKPKKEHAATIERYETLRPQLVAYIADGLSYPKIAAALGNMRIMTVWEWAQKEEIPALVAAERAKRLADAEHLRAAKLQEAHDLAWQVALGKVKITTPEQVRMLEYFLGWRNGTEQPPPPVTEGADASAAAVAGAVTHVTVNLGPDAIRRPMIEASDE